jgi:DNA-binding MarR family transcriptional regulator
VPEPAKTAFDHVPLLTSEQREAWTGFLHAHAGITRALEDDLRVHHGVPYNSFEVLALLALAPDHRMRMAELADQLVFTRSGITRLIDRLERDGHVERSECDDDARGIYAILTEKGFFLFEEAAQTHVALLHELFYGRLGSIGLAELNELWERLKSHSCREREQKLRLLASRDA